MNSPAIDIFPLMLIRAAGLPLQWPAWADAEADKLMSGYNEAVNRLQIAFSSARAAFEMEKDQMFFDDLLQKIITNARRELRKGTRNDFIETDPYLSDQRPDLARMLDNLNREVKNREIILQAVQEQYSMQHTAERRLLMQYAGNESICRALLFCSHSLLCALPQFARSDPENWHKKDRRTAAALLKYLLRATTKTTPLSRLATVGLQYPDRAPDETEEWASVFSSPKCLVTPNVALLPALYDILLRDPAFFKTLGIRLNPSIQTNLGKYEWLFFDGLQEHFQHLDVSTVLEKTREFFQNRKSGVRFCDLADMLAKHTESTAQDIQSFVFQLIDCGWVEWILPEQGLAPGWCGSLYNHLGYLPASALLTDAAYLLQWLRTAARSMPFQPVLEARQTQLEALSQCRAFFEKHGGTCPDIPAEQIFYEDVESPAQANLPLGIVRDVALQLRESIKNAAPYRISGLRAALKLFGSDILQEGESIPFLTFSKLFLQKRAQYKSAETVENEIQLEKIGALLQFFTTETGEYRAVLNGLFPGGGKMMSRWLQMFPANVREQLQDWWPGETLSFPWQDWSNTNFQPHFSSEALAVPGGRVGAGHHFSLSDLLVFRDANGVHLREKSRSRRIVFSDLGLEHPNAHPPVIQILWHMGTPFISAGIFTDRTEWVTLQEHVQHRKRIEYQWLVLARATWRIAPQALENRLEKQVADYNLAFFISIRKALAEWGVPRYFFAGTKNETTRFFDQNSPMMMQAFCKMVQRQGTGDLYLSEMLPTPEQWPAVAGGKRHAAEWALEFRSERG